MESSTTVALAPRVVTANEGPSYRIVADFVTFKATAEQTGGAYGLFEGLSLPGMGTPPHYERYEDESFYVLEGTFTFLIGGEQRVLRPGDYAFIPRGTVHAFTNTGDTPARLLCLLTPGGIHEQFFAEAGEPIDDIANAPAPSGPPNISQLVAISAKYGIEILPPPAA